MSSDVFMISSARDASAADAMRRAVEQSGIAAARIQDAIFGLDGLPSPDLDSLTRSAGLTCPAAGVSSSLRAITYAAASILSDESGLLLVTGLHPEAAAAFVFASPESVGLLNLMPRARLAARSLTGPEAALKFAELTSADIDLTRSTDHAALALLDLLSDLEAASAHWGLLTVSGASLLLERI